MELEHWHRVEQLYHAVLKVEARQRAAFLEDACGGDASLIEEIQSLLAQTEETNGFLAAPAVEVAAAALAPAPAGATTACPSAIGRYRVVRLLGEGGMGAVYEAEQDHPRRVVALKVIKPGLTTAETLRRFQFECQALGRLQHPGIAQIYEASTAETGFGPQPYFAMELIRGLPLLEYAEARRLHPRDRLELIAKICDAVAHAHHRGVIHRDLKPGNILVDETGQPKILDFGVARVTESDAQLTRHTGLGQLVGTLAYMSPEQVAGESAALDLRSDVYALGVLLYELLAGTLPYNLDRQPLHAVVEIIRMEEPAPLSSIQRSYRGDIDTIAAKALEKDKARRYGSAAELAGDIRRYLADQPITARPPTATYQIQKFARRHKALVAGTAAVFLVLAAGVIASTWEALRARKAEHAAAAEAATARAINDFLQHDLLAQASASNQAGPRTKPDPDLKVRTALDRAAAGIAGKFPRQPEVEASLRSTIGQTYTDLGLYPEARKQLERALELQRRVLGAENPQTLATLTRLARTLYAQGQYTLAEALFLQSLQGQRRVLGPENRDTLYSMSSLANVYRMQGKYAQAEALASQALEIKRRVLGPENRETLRSMAILAVVYFLQGKFAQAEALDSQTLEIARRVLGPEHPDTLAAMSGLADVYHEQGKFAQARALYSQALEIQRRVLGPVHRDTLASMNNLAAVFAEQGQYAQAAALLGQTVEIARRVLGPEHSDTLLFMSSLALIQAARGDYPQAVALLTQVLDANRRLLGPQNVHTVATLGYLASVYQQQGNYARAATYAAEALAGFRHSLGSEQPDTMVAAADLALAYLSQARFADSEPLAREAVDFFRKNRPDFWQRFRAESLLGASLAGQSKYSEAEPLLLAGYRGMAQQKDRMAVPDRYHLDRARQWVVQFYDRWGKPEKVAEWRKN